jgi:hypothetical protein
MTPDKDVENVAQALAAWISGISTEAEKLTENVASLLEQNLADKSTIGKGALLGLDEIIWEFLEKNSYAVGAGTFFDAASVEEGSSVFEWWFRRDSGALRKLEADRTPGSHRYYDYEKLPFFSAAASTGELTLWGPYVDHLGVDEYIISFTAPYFINGRFMGVSGCDLRIKDLEPLIMPDLRVIPMDAALINADDRIILGNSGTYLVGERVKAWAPNQHRVALDVPHMGLSLVYST